MHGTGQMLWSVVVVALLSTPLLSGPVVSAAVEKPSSVASETSAPAVLAVALSSDEDIVRSGDEVTLTATVSNAGAAEVPVRAVLELPSYVSVADAPDGEVTGSLTTWEVTLGAAQEKVWQADVVIGSIPDGEVRVTSVLSAFAGDQERALVRTAHAASIQGVADTPRPIPVDAADARSGAPNTTLIVAITVPVVLLLAGGGIWWWQRRRVRTRAGEP